MDIMSALRAGILGVEIIRRKKIYQQENKGIDVCNVKGNNIKFYRNSKIIIKFNDRRDVIIFFSNKYYSVQIR